MTVGESDSGNSSRIFYPGLAGRGDQTGLVAEVQYQVTELAQLRYQPWVRHGMLRLIEERRRLPERNELYLGPGLRDDADGRHYDPRSVTQFDYLPVEVGFDTLLVRDELLITKESYYGGKGLEGARSYLEQLGLVPVDTGCRALDETIFRLVPGDAETGRPGHMRGQHLADIARNLQGRGYSASVTNVVPTMGTIKGPHGPQPASPPISPDVVIGQVEKRREVRVAVVDTGIWDQRLAAVPGSEIDFLHEFPLGAPPAVRDQYLDFDAGHGTFVTGIVKQVAPHASVKVYRAIDGDGIGSEVTAACKIIQAVNDRAQIINLSFGCQTPGDYPPIALHQALRYARKEGVMVIAAAGNYADTRPCWPAAFRSVVSVAGLAPNLTPAPWATHGFWVTCSTVGQGLFSWFVDGKESPLIGGTAPAPAGGGQPAFTGSDPWAVWSGSSFAAPQITGLLAQRYQASPAGDLPALLQDILDKGRPLPGYGQAIEILPGL